jgi:hypothetical protein
VGAGELVDAGDVVVAQDRGDLGLVDQHLDEVVVLGEVREHALDRDQVGVALAVERLGPVDLGHTAERDAIEEVVPAELLGPTQRGDRTRLWWGQPSPPVGSRVASRSPTPGAGAHTRARRDGSAYTARICAVPRCLPP